MKACVDETTSALLIWDTKSAGNEVKPVGFFMSVDADPYAETARFAKRGARPHVLTRGISEFLAIFDGRGESCMNSMSPAEFMQLARAYVKGEGGPAR